MLLNDWLLYMKREGVPEFRCIIAEQLKMPVEFTNFTFDEGTSRAVPSAR